MTFYDFLIRHFKENVKSHVFLNLKKNEKYVFSNTGSNTADQEIGPPNFENVVASLIPTQLD